MVEGPGATRNARKVQPAIGYTVVSVDQVHLEEKLQHRFLTEVFSVGKEVFLLFAKHGHEDSQEYEVALRLHFGMSGCLYLHNDEAGTRSIPPWRRNTESSLKIHLTRPGDPTLSRLSLETKDSTSNFLPANVARSKMTRLYNRDVCGDAFDPVAVRDAIIAKRSNAMISDAILDQERFPGVGNIIKIEGLHRSEVHPKRLVSTLTPEELDNVIFNCRNFAMHWLSSGRAPAKAVYNQTICGTCSAPSVRMVKLGNDLSRTTFWCESCQPSNLKPGNKLQKCHGISSVQPKPLDPLHSISCCPQHRSSTLILKRVKKMNSTNRNRLFRICKVPSCPYFVWADMHFPKCVCRQIAILRVSKTERTGGRWFLSCHNASNKPGDGSRSCKFFAWAEDDHLRPFGRSLTPLL